MRKLSLVVTAFCLAIPVVLAQTGGGKVATQWKCAAPTAHMLPVPDAADHAYGIEQINCTAARGEINGVKEKDGVATEFIEATGTSSKGHGIFVATLASGDKVHYSYTFTGTGNEKQLISGSNTWTITGGTGKLKGITGKGTCAGKGNPDGTSVFDCTGTYAMK